MLTCVPCNRKHIINVPATYNVWPRLMNDDGTVYEGWCPYTYMCTECVIDALQNGMEIPHLATEPATAKVEVQAITHVKQQPEEPPTRQPDNVIHVNFEKGELD